MEKAYFGAGCFWGVEETFRQTAGVESTSVGYAGGHQADPSYQQVCTGTSGHAEAVEVAYDPAKVSYKQLLEVFWQVHDPTQHNRQGPDVGSQYRSVIFCLHDAQLKAAKSSLAALQNSPAMKGRQIATKIEPFSNYYLAEDDHQQYISKRKKGVFGWRGS